MDATAAEALLRRLILPDVVPAVSDDEVESLLFEAGAVDADGYGPGEDGWTPTFARRRVYAAAVAGLDLKLMRIAATHVHVSQDGASFAQEQAVKHLQDQRLQYQRSALGTVSARVAPAVADAFAVNWNDPNG